MKPKFRPFTQEEFDREFDKMIDELSTKYGYSIKRLEPKPFDPNKPKTYDVTFHKTKKI